MQDRGIIHAMLTRLYIDNFRCFHNFEYRPESKQLLLGANGSGKSSLFEALRLLKEFIKGRDIPFSQTSRTRWRDLPLQVFEVEALVHDKLLFSYRVEIRYSSKSNSPVVSLERLSLAGTPLFELIDGEIRSYLEGDVQTRFLRGEATESSLHLAAFANPFVRIFVEWMDTVHCFKIDSYEGAMEEVADAEDVHPDFELENLSAWYRHVLGEDPDANDAFRVSIREALPGLSNLRFSPEDDGAKKLRIDFNSSSNNKFTVSLRELSDGQRHLIGLYMILHFLIAKGHTVFIDEPDNFVSLREIQPWLLQAESSVESKHGQLILISHHPEILNYWAPEFGLYLFREENGHVRTKPYSEIADSGVGPAETVARGWEHA